MASSLETALLTVVRTLEDFGTSNSSVADETSLRNQSLAAIIRFGSTAPEPVGSSNEWGFIVTLYIDVFFLKKGGEQGVYYNNLMGTVIPEIVDAILGYPTLDGETDVMRCIPLAVEPGDSEDLKNYLMVSIPVEIMMRRKITNAEWD
jgi:hypothetical protein